MSIKCKTIRNKSNFGHTIADMKLDEIKYLFEEWFSGMNEQIKAFKYLK